MRESAGAVTEKEITLKSANTHSLPMLALKKIGSILSTPARISLALAILSVLFLTPLLHATGLDDLNNSIDTLDQAVQESTTAEATAERLLTETNATETALLIAPVMDAQIGSPVDVPLILVPGPNGNTAVQFNISVPEGLSILSVTTGPAANAVGKSVSFSTSTDSAVVFGLNQTKLVEGVVAIAHLEVSLNAKAGLYPFEMNTPVASDANGKLSPLSLTSGTLRVK